VSVISLSGVGKRYVKYDDRPLLVNHLKFWHRTSRSDLWALRNVEFDIEPGESVGILGRNGAGKSTLLQLLAGVTAPTEGVVRVRGRVAPLLSVGVGFHPELTGRENVYVNGTVLGLEKGTIDRRFDAIVEFAELEKFIDTPVKFYSSGMFVRLGFAVAVEADPDILLVDEVLAVGDFAFQMRSFERMKEIRANGATLVTVSHNLNAIRGYCDRTVVLHEGGTAFDGPTFEGISRYYQLMGQAESDDPVEAQAQVREDREALELLAFDLVDEDGQPLGHVRTGDKAALRIEARARRDIPTPFVSLMISTEKRIVIYNDTNCETPFPPIRAGERVAMQVRLPLHLVTGGYFASATVNDGTLTDHVLIARTEPVSFYVTGRGLVSGVVDLGGEFSLGPVD